MTDLGVVAGDPCSTAYGINSREQIVGVSSPCGQSGHGFLWENGGPIVDLQTLVLPGSDVTIKEVYFINDAGEIAGFRTNSNGDQRGILLIPKGDCDNDYESRIDASQSDTLQHPGPTIKPMNRRREQ